MVDQGGVPEVARGFDPAIAGGRQLWVIRGASTRATHDSASSHEKAAVSKRLAETNCEISKLATVKILIDLIQSSY